MSEETRKDIRQLLKRFGVAADEAIIEHLARSTPPQPVRLCCTLHVCDADGSPVGEPLLRVDGAIGDD